MDEKKSTQKMPAVAAVYSITNKPKNPEEKQNSSLYYLCGATECLEDAAVQF